MFGFSKLTALVEALDPDSREVGLARLEALRTGLEAKRERLLQRPLITKVVDAGECVDLVDHDLGGRLGFLQADLEASAPRGRASRAWTETKDGLVRVEIAIDYRDLWRGSEKEVLETVKGTVENHVTFLTDDQHELLLRSPREFLDLQPPPESAELVEYRTEHIGGADHVVELVLDQGPREPQHVRHVAVVPNLIPLERQLAALSILEAAEDRSVLAPLRVLLGLEAAESLGAPPEPGEDPVGKGIRLDDFQRECARKALTTPHFALMGGPPGSGKTTVISTVVRRALEQGKRVLVVSPTHVAVDNVVEKLAPDAEERESGRDRLAPHTVPLRYSAKRSKLLPAALDYWVGPRKQRRGATVARRTEAALRRDSAFRDALYSVVDDSKPGRAPLSRALSEAAAVICGTPIGILSHDSVKRAEPGSFDLLVVDEVSKMTLPEFLAVAVKAKRWVLVGDPQQLPPYNDTAENGVTLDDLLSKELELVCSVGAVVERTSLRRRGDLRLLVVCREPDRIVAGVRAHFSGLVVKDAPSVVRAGGGQRGGVVVCAPEELGLAGQSMLPVQNVHRGHNPDRRGSVRLLVERGLRVPRPDVGSGFRLVEDRDRAPAAIFDTCFGVFHAQHWGSRANQRLTPLGFRRGLDKYLPSSEALVALGADPAAAGVLRAELVEGIAERFALNAVSVFDWLAGVELQSFDTSPLQELRQVFAPVGPIQRAVAPFVDTLRKQYRMHGSISRVPRELFYFGEALDDGLPDADQRFHVHHMQVARDRRGTEDNPDEADRICELLERFSAYGESSGDRPSVLVITPYRKQEALLRRTVDAARRTKKIEHVDVEVCTLDRCQGREADAVFVSLVRSRSTPFLDSPKRWNVALTRAQNDLFLFGDIEAYLQEASRERVEGRRRGKRPRMSILARIIESQDRQRRGVEPVILGAIVPGGVA